MIGQKHGQRLIEITRLGGLTADLAARGSGQIPRAHEQHLIECNVVRLPDRRPDGLRHGRPLIGRIPRLDLLREHDPLARVVVDREHRAVPDAQACCGGLRGPFEVFRMMIDTVDDDEVFEPPGHIELTVVDKSEIARAQIRPASIGEHRAKRRGAGRRVPPVAHTHARAAQPDLADDIVGTRPPGLRIDDPHFREAATLAATDQRASANGADVGAPHAAFAQRLGITLEHGRRRAGVLGANRQHRFGQTIGWREHRGLHAHRTQGRLEVGHRVGADRLGTRGHHLQGA